VPLSTQVMKDRCWFLTREPLWLLGFLLVGLTTILACIGPLFVRRFVPLEKLRTNNEVAGFKFATVGVLYAVLLGCDHPRLGEIR
jgi:hypothetical protein